MSIELDHFIVSSRNKIASAKLLGELLGVLWAESGVGPFAPVYLNDGLTLDFYETRNQRRNQRDQRELFSNRRTLPL